MTTAAKDELKESVERESGGKQTIIRTKSGQPSYMNVIPRFNLEDIHPSLGTGPHPAFVVNGAVKERILIGTYQASIRDGEAVSLPECMPTTGINFDQARAACFSAGEGFHLMTNWEWAAIALRCAANGHNVRGNTNGGRSHTHPEECGVKGDATNKTYTGSGPHIWRHDGTPYGIADIVGNVWEWVDGLKLSSGRIIMPTDNNIHLQEDVWPETGICFDLPGGMPTLSKEVTRRSGNGKYFKDLSSPEKYIEALDSSYGRVLPLAQALLTPLTSLEQPGYFWIDNSDGFEALPFRGGDWDSGSYAGLAALYLNYERSTADSDVGFRPAFIE